MDQMLRCVSQRMNQIEDLFAYFWAYCQRPQRHAPM
jgi:hypothetical protein